MNNDSVKISVNPDNLDRLDNKSIYNPTLNYSENFYLSPMFDCSREMEKYSGDYDYHSLMHNVQKPVLTANKVEALSLFANKLLLREWTDGLIPLQKTFGFSSSLNDELEVKRLFEIVNSKVKNREEFIIKPTNGSESIGTLKVFQYNSDYKAIFLSANDSESKYNDALKVVSDYETFKQWVSDDIMGVTSGNIDTHLLHIEPGLIIQALFPHNKKQRGPTEMKYITAWGELLFVGCRNSHGVCLGGDGEHLEGRQETATMLHDKFFHKLKIIALSLAKASTFPNLRFDFFVDIESGEWVLNEIETIADCRSYSDYLLEYTGEFYLNGWRNKAYHTFTTPLTTTLLKERLKNELDK
ncbi:MAG: hypothetical protein OEW99_09275 [Gammaproteobacteria bacterium]|nr:hypothetical protein [Gammaproteobacteria bacterium]